MPSGSARSRDDGSPYPVVRLAGTIDAGRTPAVRSALLAVLVDQPEAVVIDARDARVAGPAAADVLREVARQTADWPAAHLVLCAGDPAPWQASGLPIWPSPAEAFAALGEPDAGRHLRLDLDPVVGAARRSRELVTEACGRWDLPDLAGSACIVVTEMVNNVVAHAHTPMTVLLASQGDTMSVAVRDRSGTTPVFSGAPVAPTAYGGRGLLLIDSVASRWGNLVLDDGKVVWALLPFGPDAPADRHRPAGAGMPGPGHG